MSEIVLVKISAASARLPFITCGPECLALGCKGSCCDAPTRATGCLVTIHPSEQHRIEARGGKVIDGLLQPLAGQRGCPFKSKGLCGLHFTVDKPFGCIASPFTLNSHRTLIVRNRYKLLPCYRQPGPKRSAYRAFYSSLVLIFGQAVAGLIAERLDAGGGDHWQPMPAENFSKLVANDEIKRRAA